MRSEDFLLDLIRRVESEKAKFLRFGRLFALSHALSSQNAKLQNPGNEILAPKGTSNRSALIVHRMLLTVED